MKKALGAAVLAGLVTGALAIAGPAGASSAIVSTDCSTASPGQMCVRWCYIEEGGNSRHPCGVDNTPPLPHPTSGTYSFSVPLSAAAQDATGLKGDPGGTGTANITMNASTNQVCATTSWSGIDSPVVW